MLIVCSFEAKPKGYKLVPKNYECETKKVQLSMSEQMACHSKTIITLFDFKFNIHVVIPLSFIFQLSTSLRFKNDNS